MQLKKTDSVDALPTFIVALCKNTVKYLHQNIDIMKITKCSVITKIVCVALPSLVLFPVRGNIQSFTR